VNLAALLRFADQDCKFILMPVFAAAKLKLPQVSLIFVWSEELYDNLFSPQLLILVLLFVQVNKRIFNNFLLKSLRMNRD